MALAPPATRGLKAIAAILLCVLAVLYVRANVVEVIRQWSGAADFDVYYRAAKDIAEGISPYENAAYFYPPLVAFCMTPFAWTDYHTARWLWLLLSHALLLAAAWLTWRAAGKTRSALICVALVWAMGGAAAETLRIGQLSPVLLVALAAAYDRRAVVQDSAVGAAFALKYFPGVLAVALFLRRGWRGLRRLAAIGLLAVSVPWLVLTLFFAGPKLAVKPSYWLGTPSMFSWSLPSEVLRILTPIRRGPHLPFTWEHGNVAATLHLAASMRLLSAGVSLVTLAGGILALAISVRGRLSAAQLPPAMAALISLALVAAPVSWTHYQVLQYPGVAFLLCLSLHRHDWRTACGVLICFALCYQVPEAVLIHYHNTHSGWSAYSPLTFYLWTAVPAAAMIGLFACALSAVRRTLMFRAEGREPEVRYPAD